MTDLPSHVGKPVYSSFKVQSVFPVYRKGNWGPREVTRLGYTAVMWVWPKTAWFVWFSFSCPCWCLCYLAQVHMKMTKLGRSRCSKEFSLREKLWTSNSCLFPSWGWNMMEMRLLFVCLNHEKSQWVREYLVRKPNMNLLILGSWKYHFPYC